MGEQLSMCFEEYGSLPFCIQFLRLERSLTVMVRVEIEFDWVATVVLGNILTVIIFPPGGILLYTSGIHVCKVCT